MSQVTTVINTSHTVSQKLYLRVNVVNGGLRNSETPRLLIVGKKSAVSRPVLNHPVLVGEGLMSACIVKQYNN